MTNTFMRKTAFIFPGQGSQYVGMGKTMCEQFSAAKKTFDKAGDVCGFDVLKFSSENSYNNLINHKYSLVSLLTVTVATFRVFQEEIREKPDYLAGHSFGELSALVCSGSIAFADALLMALDRGIGIRKVAEKREFAMAAASGLDYRIAGEICRELSDNNHRLDLAIINNDNNVVVSGDIDLIRVFKKKASKILDNIRFSDLALNAPFHGPYFREESHKFKEELNGYSLKTPSVTIISSLTAKPLKTKKDIVDSLSGHLTRTVYWNKTMDFLYRKGVDTIIEIGPQKIFSRDIKNKSRIKSIHTFCSPNDVAILKDIFIMNKKKIMELTHECMAAALTCKNNNHNSNKDYNNLVVLPYIEIEKKFEFYKNHDKEPSIQFAKDAFLMLNKVMIGKKIGKTESQKLIKSIYKKHPGFKMVINFEDIC